MPEIRWDLLANLGKTFTDSYDAGRKRRDEDLSREADREEARLNLQRLAGGGASTAPATTIASLGTAPSASAAPKLPTFAQGDRIGQYAEAIAAKESGGRYDAVGPTHAKLGRALGKYQVMEANVAPWTREALGRELSAQEFLADPQAQDAVFKHRFGKYVAETGSPEDAASMWFTGRPAAEGANKRDVLGTTGRSYVESFRSNLARAQGAPDLPATKVAMPGEGAAPAADLPVEKGAEVQFQVPGQPALPPGVSSLAAQIQGMLKSSNPFVVKRGNEYAQKYLTGDKYGFQVVGDKLYRTDPRTGAAAPIADAQKPTSDLQEYEYYRRQAREQGQKPDDFTTWARGNKAAGATQVTVGDKGDAEFAKKTGGALAERFDKISQEGDAGRTDLALIGQLRALGQEMGGTGAAAAAKAWLAERGVKLGENVGEIEAYGALVDKLTPQQRVPGSGATSDFDAKMFKASLPRLINTPGGNALVMDTLETLAKDKIARAEIAEKGLTGELKPGEVVKQLRALPSPNTMFRERLAKVEKGEAAAPQPQGQGQGARPPVDGARQAGDGNWYLPDPARPGKYLMVKP